MSGEQTKRVRFSTPEPWRQYDTSSTVLAAINATMHGSCHNMLPAGFSMMYETGRCSALICESR